MSARIVQVMGPVVDIQFPEGSLPAIFNAIEIDGNPTKDIHIHLTTEVVQHIGQRYGAQRRHELY